MTQLRTGNSHVNGYPCAHNTYVRVTVTEWQAVSTISVCGRIPARIAKYFFSLCFLLFRRSRKRKTKNVYALQRVLIRPRMKLLIAGLCARRATDSTNNGCRLSSDGLLVIVFRGFQNDDTVFRGNNQNYRYFSIANLVFFWTFTRPHSRSKIR